jgi:hypothetical protein
MKTALVGRCGVSIQNANNQTIQQMEKAAENLLSHPIRVIQAGVSPFLEGDPIRDEARDASRDEPSLAKEQS